MARLRVSGRGRAWLAAVVIMLPACAPVEHGPRFIEAAAEMERTTGLKPLWGSTSELQDLTLEQDGVLAPERAVTLTLANNRALRADLEMIAQANADLVQAGLPSNPLLSLMLRFPEGGGRASLDFGLSKDIAELWLIPSRKLAAQRMLQQRILSFVDSAIVLVNEVKRTYHTVQYQEKTVSLQGQNVAILREALELAQARFRAGDASLLDVNLTRGRLLEAEVELIGARSEWGVARQTLLRLLGVSRSTQEWTTAPLEPSSPKMTADEADIVELAIQSRLDLRAAWWELEAAVAEVEVERGKVIPSLGIGLAAERTERRAIGGRKLLADTARSSINAGELTAPDIQSRADRRRERSAEIDFMLGPSVEIPLPIFDQNQAMIAKAQARARELKERYAEMEQRVIEGVRAALSVRRLAEERATFFHESLIPQQESNLSLAEKTYQAGQESILTVLVAQEALIRSRLSHVAALRDLAVSTADLERQISAQIPDFLVRPRGSD